MSFFALIRSWQSARTSLFTSFLGRELWFFVVVATWTLSPGDKAWWECCLWYSSGYRVGLPHQCGLVAHPTGSSRTHSISSNSVLIQSSMSERSQVCGLIRWQSLLFTRNLSIVSFHVIWNMLFLWSPQVGIFRAYLPPNFVEFLFIK